MYHNDPRVLDVLVRDRRNELLEEARIFRMLRQHRQREHHRRRR